MKFHSIKDIFSDRPTKERYEEDLYKVKKVPYKKDDMWRLSKLLAAKPTRIGRDDRRKILRRRTRRCIVLEFFKPERPACDVQGLAQLLNAGS